MSESVTHPFFLVMSTVNPNGSW